MKEIVAVGAIDFGQILCGELRLLGPAARFDALHEHFRGRLQVHDEIGAGRPLRQQVIELLVEQHLAVVEVEVREELALLEDVVGERHRLEELALAAAPAAVCNARGGRRARSGRRRPPAPGRSR